MAYSTDRSMLENYLSAWTRDPGGVKKAFLTIIVNLDSRGDTTLSFKDRPGVCHSLRAVRASQEWRPYFILVDVIEDDPEDRWLSICFYADMIDDPLNLGNVVPEGINHLDGHCFDLDEDWDQDLLEYLLARIDQAHEKAENL